jgi:hypothetical protein
MNRFQKLSKKLMKRRVVAYLVILVGWLGRLGRALGREIFSFLALLANVRVWLVMDIAALGVALGLLHLAVMHGPNVIALSVAAFSEGKGESPEGRQAIVASIFERVARSDFPTTPASVVYQVRSNGQGCQYDGPCDRVPDNLDSALGRQVLLETLRHYVAWELGVFRSPVPGCHSYATKAGYANAPAYFNQFPERVEVGNHIFACGEAVATSDSKLAVAKSPRPLARPVTPINLQPRIEFFFTKNSVRGFLCIGTSSK